MRTAFKEKFGTPRGSGLAPKALGRLELYSPYQQAHWWSGLEGHSHFWVHFLFHKNPTEKNLKPTVRPPRLGGKKRLGVFSTRTPHRPNSIGLSLLKLHEIKRVDEKVELTFSGVDMVDKTPIFDIRPYMPETDSLCLSNHPHFDTPSDHRLAVQLSSLAASQIKESALNFELLRQVLERDPRPSHQKAKHGPYSMLLADNDVHWHIEQRVFGPCVIIDEIEKRSL